MNNNYNNNIINKQYLPPLPYKKNHINFNNNLHTIKYNTNNFSNFNNNNNLNNSYNNNFNNFNNNFKYNNNFNNNNNTFNNRYEIIPIKNTKFEILSNINNYNNNFNNNYYRTIPRPKSAYFYNNSNNFYYSPIEQNYIEKILIPNNIKLNEEKNLINNNIKNSLKKFDEDFQNKIKNKKEINLLNKKILEIQLNQKLIENEEKKKI